MSLRTKLFVAISVTLFFVLGLLIWLTLTGERERFVVTDNYRKATLLLAAEIASRVSPEQLLLDTTLVDANGAPMRELRSIAILRRDASGAVVIDQARGALSPQRAEAAGVAKACELASQAFDTGTSRPDDDGDAIAVPSPPSWSADPAAKPATVVYLEVEPTPVDPVHATRIGFVVVVGAALVLLLVTWFIVDRVVARPLTEVVRGANRVAVADYSQPVPASGGDDEIQKVITSFNAMMVELGTVQGRMRERTADALLTARKTQDSLVIAQRLASTGRLAAGIAHEVNNPLAGMINAVRSLRTKDMPPAKRDEYLQIVEEGLHRIQVTVAKILQFTPHKVAPQPVNMENVVRPVLALARHRIEKEQVEVAAQFPQEAAVVFGDPYELQQALLNVLLNALDALEEAHRETPRIEVVTSVLQDEVHLLVRDNGVGMKEEDLPRAFDLFFTTKEPGKGTGLGLATSHKILTDHGGRVDLRSRGSEGMDVVFVLPRFHG